MRRRVVVWLVVLLALPLLAHGCVLITTDMTPPAVSLPDAKVTTAKDDPSRREIGRSWSRKRGRINEIRLVGGPTDIGSATVRLLYDEQVTIERDLQQQFSHFVPFAPARWLIVDLARLRFRRLDQLISKDHRLEIAAQARSFDPDPFESLMGTYQRFVFLHSLYDIMLSFERSPLIGCTSFVINDTRDGHTLVGRNFDFEGPQVLDDHKAVFLMLEEGKIPYASISWPGFVGTTSGMNLEGVAIVIHGARAGEPRATGEPVVQTVRDLLRGAHTTREAVAMLSGRAPMVPHMLLIADAAGDSVVVERVPGHAPHLREQSGSSLALTNHLEGPHADDPKNADVIRTTSTTPRRARLDELIARTRRATPQHVATMLRDKRGAGNAKLPLGHRSAIDALIATHSAVMDTTARVMWVNEGPHATGRYLRFDLRKLLAEEYRPSGPADVDGLPADTIVADGSFAAWQDAGATHARPD
jgi:isopenicillin-N N-acyltransferase-like protein